MMSTIFVVQRNSSEVQIDDSICDCGVDLKRVVVHCRGRIGNQFFQVAAGWKLATHFGCPLTINILRSGENPDSRQTDIGAVIHLSNFRSS